MPVDRARAQLLDPHDRQGHFSSPDGADGAGAARTWRRQQASRFAQACPRRGRGARRRCATIVFVRRPSGGEELHIVQQVPGDAQRRRRTTVPKVRAALDFIGPQPPAAQALVVSRATTGRLRPHQAWPTSSTQAVHRNSLVLAGLTTECCGGVLGLVSLRARFPHYLHRLPMPLLPMRKSPHRRYFSRRWKQSGDIIAASADHSPYTEKIPGKTMLLAFETRRAGAVLVDQMIA